METIRGVGFGISRTLEYFFTVPRILRIVCWGLYWSPFILENHHLFNTAIPQVDPPPSNNDYKGE